MNRKLARLAQQRQVLLEQCAQQRATLTQAAAPWRNTLAQADKGVAALRYLRSHPIWFAGGGGLLLALLGPGRVWRWLGRGWFGLQMYNRLRSKG